MKVEQIYTGCLAHGAYYIESNGEVAIIDPLRETEPYLQRAEKDGARIKYILETHFHADFVSGHLDLATKTAGTIVYGPTAKPAFPAYVGKHGEKLKLGNVEIELLHTPGHTMESSCFLLYDENGKPTALFTGDTLFIGDVGRPDLAQHVIAELTQEKLADHLYDSLRTVILPLPDDLVVYPGHGAGSACGKKMSSETTDTLGHQKATNYALRPGLSKDEFRTELLTGLTPPPAYFPQNVLMNIKGYESLDEVMHRGMTPLTPIAFEAAVAETDALVLDTRKPEDFIRGYIPGSINIGIDGNFAPWAGALIPDVQQDILLVCEPGREEEVIIRLSRVGFDHTIGYLNGGFEAWKKAGNAIDQIQSVSTQAFASAYKNNPELPILDVRKQSEYDSEHILGAVNAPLDYVNESMLLAETDKTWYVHCAGGYRSVIFISILQARGYRNLINVEGGFKAIKDTGEFRISEYHSPATML
ncbi:MAG: MBL fold metallo-hydrolase [Bacteroidetes bacterium]|nr:MBL fold metallo-hydrolase [Bacteroidota bacterium]